MSQIIASKDLIIACLEYMGEGSTLLDYELLGGGISGAGTYRLRLSTGHAVLKVTSADSEDYRLERSRREMAFFLTLAPQLPLRVPEVLGGCESPDLGICLLLAAYTPMRAADWNRADYLAVAEELAQLHAVYWGQSHRLDAYDWLRRPDVRALSRDIDHAREAWRALHEIPRFGPVLSGPTLDRIIGLLERERAIEDALATLPLTLCHGDCHADNLLRASDGGLVWADWQEVGIGPGSGDLSFFFQRATFGRAPLPTEIMIETYRRTLENATGEKLPSDAIQRVLAADELRTRLLAWPDYLARASEEQMAGMIGRIRELAVRLGLSDAMPRG
ncbi:MAG TPA: aminoglycoside phosphotransferase family protein [Chloroflexi bacterium]|jgi:aminoglycoside phosphotransferase (APT) family kinase protein|nr:aminoglycoside phosphotransferase family protein [Chloroflexota bacterium]